MLVWLLALLLLFGFLYVVYRMNFIHQEIDDEYEDEHHYTFKM